MRQTFPVRFGPLLIEFLRDHHLSPKHHKCMHFYDCSKTLYAVRCAARLPFSATGRISSAQNISLLYQVLITMKLTVFLLLTVACLSAAASALAQQVTLSEENVSLAKVFKTLRKQSQVDFVISSSQMKRSVKVTVKVTDRPLHEVLDKIFENQPLTYTVKNKTIVVQDKPISEKQATKTDIWQEIRLTLRGIVSDTTGAPLPGVSVSVRGTTTGTITDESGKYELNNVPEDAIIKFSMIGFVAEEIAVKRRSNISLVLREANLRLGEVSIVSTGFQEIPAERATGSFSQVDNKLFNRSVSTDIMSRLADVVPGLIFNKGYGGAAGLTIRGQNSIDPNTSKPLIIVDNFPYENDINNINPNDIESVTILKDAAAASIWGARAGNGVIVITTKKGSNNQRAKLSFNSNVTIGAKPDLFYQPKMSSADFIEVEKELFNKGYYKPTELNDYLMHYPLTPVVELLIAKRDGIIGAGTADAEIEALKKQDVRNDYNKYLYRQSINQQYALNLTGGTANQRYFLSAGYDKNLNSLKENSYERFTVNANNTYFFFKNKLEFTTAIYYTESKTKNNNSGLPTYTSTNGSPGTGMYPYAKLVDDNGNSLPVIHNLRVPFVEQAQSKGLLNWGYKPIDEIHIADNVSRITDFRVNANLRYIIFKGLSAEILYQYSNNPFMLRNYQSQQTYYTRDLINQITQVSQTTDGVIRPIPLGGIMDQTNTDVRANNARAQLIYNREWDKHSLNAIGGYEIRNQKTLGTISRLYGYNDDYATSQPVDYLNAYPSSLTPLWPVRIYNPNSQNELTDRFLSYYANGTYIYKNRYLLSASARFDQSNLLGVKTNQRGVPLYSVGTGWTINEESFYHLNWLPVLRLRATYGIGGNVNKSISGYTTIYYGGRDWDTSLPYAAISNPPNPDLRWEQIKTTNIGLDFGLLRNRITGTVEYYHKKGTDIIGAMPYSGQSGVTTFTGNYANTTAQGIDITLNTQNFQGEFGWNSTLLFSSVTDKVTDYDVEPTRDGFLGAYGMFISPSKGRPLFSVYSYPWAGLDPRNGDPQGYLNGEVSKNWEGIYEFYETNPTSLHYNGPARPTIYGAMRNTFTFKQFSVSANLSYRFGHYFVRDALSYSPIFQGTITHGDYGKRWQKSGDEAFTKIPSKPVEEIGFRDGFYTQSSAVVEKGDNIRFQDIVLNYNVSKSQHSKLPLENVQVYVYVNNLGILWKATKTGLDPDYYKAPYPPVRTFSLGIKANL